MKIPLVASVAFVFVSCLFAGSLANDVVNHNTEKLSKMKYELTPLEYPTDALEPWIDQRTVEFHHGKHQAAYVAKLNAALESDPSFSYEGSVENLISHLDKVPEKIRTAVRNNGGGVWNHTFYWRSLSPEKTELSQQLLNAINKSFGSFENFKKKMSEAAVNTFGSGWAWLGVEPDGNLVVCSSPNQDNPLMGNSCSKCSAIPILCVDVWEHSYYLQYQNRRPEYVDNIWNIVNWARVSKRYEYAVAEHRTLL